MYRPWFQFFENIVLVLEEVYQNSGGSSVPVLDLLKHLHALPLPKPGQLLLLSPMGIGQPAAPLLPLQKYADRLLRPATMDPPLLDVTKEPTKKQSKQERRQKIDKRREEKSSFSLCPLSVVKLEAAAAVLIRTKGSVSVCVASVRAADHLHERQRRETLCVCARRFGSHLSLRVATSLHSHHS